VVKWTQAQMPPISAVRKSTRGRANFAGSPGSRCGRWMAPRPSRGQ
jgi:hypothetical protein